MKEKPEIVIGARGSALSTAQTMQVIRKLRRIFPGYRFTFRAITTLGDRVKEWSRDAKGIFVKEIEDALLEGSIDIAVHSMKDLPSSAEKGLCLAAAAGRRDARDCVITRDGRDLMSLREGSLVGTTSLRRQAQLLRLRPDLRVAGLRGNLDTRIRKLNDGLYDAIIVARAGMQRLRIKGARVKVIPERQMLQACGQGVLGLEIRKGNRTAARIAAALNERRTLARVEAERSFLRHAGGGCRLPVAVHGKVAGGKIDLRALIISRDGKRSVEVRGSAPLKGAQGLARRLAREALDSGGREILAEIDNEP